MPTFQLFPVTGGRADPAAGTTVQAETVTARQEAILRCVAAGMRRTGCVPTTREIASAVGLRHHTTVAYQLRELERKGLIVRVPGRRRAVEVLVRLLDADQLVATAEEWLPEAA